MERKIAPLSRRAIAILLLIIPTASFLALIMTSLLLPQAHWPPEPVAIAGAMVGPIALVGFLIYGANLRDERTILVSDKAARNGFMFMVYVIPILLVVLSVTGFTAEAVLPLLVIWIGTVASACVSAFYYYRKY
ncbi:MAG: hypothetical protein ACFFEF_14830 [Candidatus Thorarchaeota archaeon]